MVADNSAKTHRAWLAHGEYIQRNLPNVHQHEAHAAELTRFIADCLEHHQLFPAEASWRKHVPQITLFTYLCAPRRGSARGLEAAAEMLISFFLLDDYWAEIGLSSGPSKEMSRRLSFIDQWLESLEARFPGDPQPFLESFEQYRKSLYVESQFTTGARRLTRDDYVDRQWGRFQWVGTPPYIDLWELTEGVSISPEHRALCLELRAFGVELTYLVNDIGSALRELKSGEPNYVCLLMRDADIPLAAALERATVEYVSRADGFHRTLDKLPQNEQLWNYADLVANVIDGNLLAHMGLSTVAASQRYAEENRKYIDMLWPDGLLVRPHGKAHPRSSYPSS